MLLSNQTNKKCLETNKTSTVVQELYELPQLVIAFSVKWNSIKYTLMKPKTHFFRKKGFCNIISVNSFDSRYLFLL